MELQSVRELKAAIRTELVEADRVRVMRAPPVPEDMVGRGLPRMRVPALPTPGGGRDPVPATVA